MFACTSSILKEREEDSTVLLNELKLYKEYTKVVLYKGYRIVYIHPKKRANNLDN